MKKIRTLVMLTIVSALFFSACSFTGGNGNGGSGKQIHTKQLLKFNVGGSSALAIVDDSDDSRCAIPGARNATTDAMIMKILEDGTMESFLSLPDGCNASGLSTINYIAQSPADDANEIYIVFNGDSYVWYDGKLEDEEGNVETVRESIHIGQLICVSADGYYNDILAAEENTWRHLYGSSKDSIAFDKQGYMYYLVNEWNGNTANTNMIYKYNPKTNESTQLTAPIENTYYDKFQVSNDGKWIFAKANRWSSSNSTSFLRAIDTADPNNQINLFYSSGSSGWLNDWIYDDDANCIYYNLSGSMYRIPCKDGNFDKENRELLFSGDSNNWFSYGDKLLNWTNSTSTYTWAGGNEYVYDNEGYLLKDYKRIYFRNPLTEEHEIIYENILKYFKGNSFSSMKEETGSVSITNEETGEQECFSTRGYKKTVLDENGAVVSEEDVFYNPDEYEMRFDIFETVPGYEVLASETKDANGKALADLELIKALTEKDLLKTFYSLCDDRYNEDTYFSFYTNNFYADVLYNKKTGKLIDKEFFKMSNMNPAKFDTRAFYVWHLLQSTYSNCNYTWNSELVKKETLGSGTNATETTVVDAEKVLALLKTYCGNQNIDFRLTAFKDEAGYKNLYSELENEEAIEFLDNSVKIEAMRNFMDNNWDSNNGHGKFLYLTCFKKGTNEPAYAWKVNNSSSIYWGCVSNLTTSYKSSLYGTYDNKLVEIVNTEGVPTGKYVDAISGYAVVNTLVSDNGFYFKNALLDSTNEETGYHQLSYFNVKDSQLKNLFVNVAHKNNLEIITFCCAGDYVYFSAAKGMSVINEKININTLAVTELTSSQKLSQIMAIK